MSKLRSHSRYIPKHVQKAVRQRDKNRCRYCGTKYPLHFDHITPYSKGAPATVENIQLLCERCNLKKRDKTRRECTACGGWNAHDAEYCHHCGTSQPRARVRARAKNLSYTGNMKLQKSGWKRKARKIILIILLLDLLYIWYEFSP